MANANSTIEIELEIKQALDRLNKMQRELQKQADEFDKAGRASEKFERAVKASMSGAGSAIRKTLGAFTSLQSAVIGLASAYSAKEFIEFGAAYEREISKLNALTKATAEEQLLLRAAIREVGSSTAYTATQAAEAANVLASLGRNSTQIAQELGVVVQVAGATSTEISLVSDAVAAQAKVFELSAKTVGDVFAAAYATSAANVEKLSTALGYIGLPAKQAGLDIYETAGAISYLIDRGIEASTVGTSLRGMLSGLIDPTKAVQDEFEKLGINFESFQQLRFEDQLREIAKQLRGVGTQAERNQSVVRIFGREALSAASSLIEGYSKGNDVISEQAQKLKEATDAATLYDKITSDLRGAIDSLIAAVQDKLLTAFQTLEPLIKGVVDDLTKSINDLTTLDVVNAVGRLGKFLLTVAEEFYNAIRLAINSISQFLNSSQFSQLMDLAGRALSSLGFTSVEEDIARQEAVFFEALANYRSARADLERMQQELDPQDEGAQIQIASAQQIVDRYQQIMVQEHQRFLLMEAQAEKLREQYELLGPQDDAFAKANQRLEEGIQHITERVQETEKLIAKQKEANEAAPAGGVSADQVSAQIAKATEEPLDRMTEKVQLASLATQRLAEIINSDLSGPDKINQLEALSQAILDAVDPADFVALGVEADDVYIKLIRLSEGADQVAQNLRKVGEQEIQEQQFLAVQQAMTELLRLGEEEKKQRQEVADIIAGINLRGVETSEIEKLNRSYAAEISAIMLNTNYTLSQRVEIANALKDARDREAEGLEEVLSFQEMITDELQTQLGLSKKAAKAAVSGYFGAGPSASRAGNILQSKSLEEAAYKLVFSNEKVASAINEQFELLFDVIDPLLDQLALIHEAINRLIKAFLNAGQNIADSLGIGQDSYLFGGGFTKDLESFFGGGGRSRPRGPTQTQIMALGARDYTSEAALEQLTADIERFGAAAVESYILGSQSILRGFADRITEIGKEIIKLGDQRDELQAAIDKAGDNANYTLVTPITQIEAKIQTLGEELKEALAAYDKLGSDVKQALNEVLIPAIRNVVDEINDYAAPLLADFAETAGIEALATEKGISIGQARIQYINDEQLAILAAQTALAAYITDAEEQAAILAEISAATQAINDLNEKQLQQFKTTSQEITDSAIADIERRGLVFTEQQEIEYRYAKEIAAAQENTNLTTADQIRLVNALEAARQREIDAIERSQYLLGLTQAQTGLAEILKTFQDAIQSIQETVEGLYDQAKSLLFSDFNLMPVMDQFQLASAEYQNLLEKAFSPDATEEDIENLQGFVNQYLTSAKDVFKSSSKFQEIFEGVLADLTTLGVNYGIVAPIGAAGEAREDIADLGEEFGISVEELITSLDSLVVAFTNQQLELVYNTFEVDISDQIFFTISEEGYIVEIPATSIEVSIAEDFSATATFTPEITGFSTSDEDTTGDYSGYASFDAELTGFGLTAEDTTGVYNGYSSFFANLSGMSTDSENPQEYNGYSSFFANLTGMSTDSENPQEYNGYSSFFANLSGMSEDSENPQEYNGYSSFFANLSGMSTDSENPQEYNGYSSFFANLSGMSEDSENPFEINGYSSLTATLSNMNMDSENPFEISGYSSLTATLTNMSADSENPFEINGYAGLAATLSNLSVDADDPYVLDGYARLRATLTNLTTSSIAPYILDAYTSLRGWATNMSWDSTSPYQLDAYSTLVANLTVDDSGFTSAWSSFQVAVTTAVNDFIDLLNAAIEGIESGEPIPTTLAEITYPARPTPGVSGAGVSASDYGTYNLAYKYSESSRGIVESLGRGIYDQIANPLESYVIQFSQGYNRYMFTFDDLTTAEYYYNLYAGESPTKYGFRQGGLVPDPMDTIPAMLSPGEYILSPETVRRFGVSSLNQLNSGDASAISQTNDPEVKRLLAELIQAVRESDTEVNVYTDMRGQAKAAVEEFRSEIKERSRRQGDQFIPVRYI